MNMWYLPSIFTSCSRCHRDFIRLNRYGICYNCWHEIHPESDLTEDEKRVIRIFPQGKVHWIWQLIRLIVWGIVVGMIAHWAHWIK